MLFEFLNVFSTPRDKVIKIFWAGYVAQLIGVLASHIPGPGFDPQNHMKTGMVLQSYNANIWEWRQEDQKVSIGYS